MSKAMDRQDALLRALYDLTRDVARAECPCADCMSKGCQHCAGVGVDLDSLRTMRKMVADALDNVKRERGKTIALLAQKLRSS
jgi:hypothetical protein